MFIVLLDEPGLFVFPSVKQAEEWIEPPDAEREIRAAFDDSAVPYKVEWLRPNKERALLLGASWVTFGEYRFIPAGPPDPAALSALIDAHPFAASPEAQNSLDQLRSRLRAA